MRKVTAIQDQYFRFFRNCYDLAIRNGWDRDKAMMAASRLARQMSKIGPRQRSGVLANEVLYVTHGIVPEWEVSGGRTASGNHILKVLFSHGKTGRQEESL